MLRNSFFPTQNFQTLAELHLIIRSVGLRIKAETQQYSGRKKHVT